MVFSVRITIKNNLDGLNLFGDDLGESDVVMSYVYTITFALGDVRCVSLVVGLDTGFRKVVPDFVVTSGNHVEERNEECQDGWGVLHPKLLAGSKRNPPSSAERNSVCTYSMYS